MKILGIHIGHDSSAALVVDGKIVERWGVNQLPAMIAATDIAIVPPLALHQARWWEADTQYRQERRP